jgi:hypothetical protein
MIVAEVALMEFHLYLQKGQGVTRLLQGTQLLDSQVVNVCLISCKTKSRKCQQANLNSPVRMKHTAQSEKGMVRATAVIFATGKPANRFHSCVTPLLFHTIQVTFDFQLLTLG